MVGAVSSSITQHDVRKALVELVSDIADGLGLVYSDPDYWQADQATKSKICSACLSTAVANGGSAEECRRRLVAAGADADEATAALAGMMAMWMHLQMDPPLRSLH